MQPLEPAPSAPLFDESTSRALADAYALILDIRRRRLAEIASPAPEPTDDEHDKREAA